MSGYADNTVADAEDLTSRKTFIQKPFNSKTLVQKIRAALDS
jgi:hypothetical protein